MQDDPIMKFFSYAHLPEGPLRECSERFAKLANELAQELKPSAEAKVALRKLLESKDAAVRACL